MHKDRKINHGTLAEPEKFNRPQKPTEKPVGSAPPPPPTYENPQENLDSKLEQVYNLLHKILDLLESEK